MPNFKPKNIKKIVIDKNIQSLDCIHEEFLKEFNDIENNTMPNLLKEKKRKKNKI